MSFTPIGTIASSTIGIPIAYYVTNTNKIYVAGNSYKSRLLFSSTEQLNDIATNSPTQIGTRAILAVGNNNLLLTSTNGISWTTVNPGMGANINKVYYDKQRTDFYVGSTVGNVKYNTAANGLTWTTINAAGLWHQNLPTSAQTMLNNMRNEAVKGIAWGGNVFSANAIIAGTTGIVSNSNTDGIPHGRFSTMFWTTLNAAVGSGFNTSYTKLAYSSNVWLLHDSQYITRRSTDGSTWTQVLTGTYNLAAPTYGNSVWVVGGMSSSTNTVTLYTSSDNGVSFTTRNISASTSNQSNTYVSAAHWNGSRLFIGTRYGLILSSSNGTTWGTTTSNTTGDILSFASGQGSTVASTSTSTSILVANNPANTTSWSVGSNTGISSPRIYFDNGIWVAAGSSIWKQSTDRVTWTTVTSPGAGGNFRTVHFSDGVWTSGQMRSTNLTSWTTMSSTATTNDIIRQTVYGQNNWLAIQGNNTIVRSMPNSPIFGNIAIQKIASDGAQGNADRVYMIQNNLLYYVGPLRTAPVIYPYSNFDTPTQTLVSLGSGVTAVDMAESMTTSIIGVYVLLNNGTVRRYAFSDGQLQETLTIPFSDTFTKISCSPVYNEIADADINVVTITGNNGLYHYNSYENNWRFSKTIEATSAIKSLANA